MVQSVTANQLHLGEHVPAVFDGDLVIFSAARDGHGEDSSCSHSWRPYVAGDVVTYSVDCSHHDMLTSDSLSIYGAQLKRSLEA
ncbi:thioesterase domain-containing protein [Mycobacterium sp. URHB0021]|jgi:thioesterase domain-containing protein